MQAANCRPEEGHRANGSPPSGKAKAARSKRSKAQRSGSFHQFEAEEGAGYELPCQTHQRRFGGLGVLVVGQARGNVTSVRAKRSSGIWRLPRQTVYEKRIAEKTKEIVDLWGFDEEKDAGRGIEDVSEAGAETQSEVRGAIREATQTPLGSRQGFLSALHALPVASGERSAARAQF